MCLLKDAIYVNFISRDLMKWRLWLVLSLVSYNIHIFATEKLTKTCSTLRGLLSPQFCIFSWTELLKHVREQATLRGSCISRASSAVLCRSDCRSDVQSLHATLSVLLQGRYFQDEKQDSEDYWLTVSGDTVGRCQAQAKSPDTFRHSPSPSQVSAALLGLTMALVTGVVLSSQKDPCCRIFTKTSSAHCVRHHDMEPQRNYAQECGLGPKGIKTSGWHVTMLQN